jgi:hypothetical protein
MPDIPSSDDLIDAAERRAEWARERAKIEAPLRAELERKDRVLGEELARKLDALEECARLRESLAETERNAASAIAGMAERIDRLERELSELRVLAEVRGAGCQCGEDEACAFVRQRDRLREALANYANPGHWDRDDLDPKGRNLVYLCVTDADEDAGASARAALAEGES